MNRHSKQDDHIGIGTYTEIKALSRTLILFLKKHKFYKSRTHTEIVF